MSEFSDKQDIALVQLALQYQSTSGAIDWVRLAKEFPTSRGVPRKKKLALRQRLKTLKRRYGKDLRAFPPRFDIHKNQNEIPVVRQSIKDKTKAAPCKLKIITPRPVLSCQANAKSTPVMPANPMSVHDVYFAITQIFATITPADIRQPSGDRGLNAGEILPVGVTEMIDAIGFRSSDVFGDIGSGIGSVLAQVVLQTPVARCIGVEIRKTLAFQSTSYIQRCIHQYYRLSLISIMLGDIKRLTSEIHEELRACSILLCNNKVFDPLDNLAVQGFMTQSNARMVILSERFCGRCHGERCSSTFCQAWKLGQTIKVAVSWAACPIPLHIFYRRDSLHSSLAHSSTNSPTLIELLEKM